MQLPEVGPEVLGQRYWLPVEAGPGGFVAEGGLFILIAYPGPRYEN